VPAHERVGPDNDQDLLPLRPQAAQRDPEESIGRPHPRPRSLGREDGELLAEGQILDQKVGPRRAQASEPIQDGSDSGTSGPDGGSGSPVRRLGPGFAIRSPV
jgi:hypothetical protein